MAYTAVWNDANAIVLDCSSLIRIIETIVNRHGPDSLLLICSSKSQFLDDLFHAVRAECRISGSDRLEYEDEDQNGLHDHDEDLSEDERLSILRHTLLQPTLHMLSRTKTLKIVFCSSVPHSLAYLTKISLQSPVDGPLNLAGMQRMLLVLDPISQHRDTRSFSAQGLARFFSLASRAAQAMTAKLVVAEYSGNTQHAEVGTDEEMDESLFSPAPERNVWDKEIAMVNITTKTFGVGDKGWQGRMVTCRRVAERWCDFISL